MMMCSYNSALCFNKHEYFYFLIYFTGPHLWTFVQIIFKCSKLQLQITQHLGNPLTGPYLVVQNFFIHSQTANSVKLIIFIVCILKY